MSSPSARRPRAGLGLASRRRRVRPAHAWLPLARTSRTGHPRAIYSASPPLDALPEIPCPSRHPVVRRRNPSAAAVGFSPPLLPRRQEAAPETRKEVRKSTTPLVDVLVLCTARSCSPVSPPLPSRAAAPSSRAAASPPRPPPLLALFARELRVDETRTSNRGQKP
jgi:hypothetical protein